MYPFAAVNIATYRRFMVILTGLCCSYCHGNDHGVTLGTWVKKGRSMFLLRLDVLVGNDHPHVEYPYNNVG